MPPLHGLILRSAARERRSGRQPPVLTAPSAAQRAADERVGHVDDPRTDVLAEALRLRVEPRRRRDAVAEDPDDDEVERTQVRELVAADLEVRRLGDELAEPLNGERRGQPVVGVVGGRPQPDVGVATLVPGPRAAHRTERAR